MARRPGRMAEKGGNSFRKTDRELVDEELKLLLRTTIDWEILRPKVLDYAVYDQLIAEVNEATKRNESIGQLRSRLQRLGIDGLGLAKKVVGLLA